ncbi:aldehyde dehydrogenase family protein [Streptomyces sp. NPDC050743]|uniref:aldehyde dehydrogenase family protein n=1 Tax=Streptomyces sp. NPDC050743 TaxID=3365634 RepID=UPI0037ABC21B
MRRVAAASGPGSGRQLRRSRPRRRRPHRERRAVLCGQSAEQRSDLLREYQDPGPPRRYREVVEFCTAMAHGAVVGDALDPDTRIGPLVSRPQRERVLDYIKTGLNEGARLTTGGGPPPGLDRGWFDPTILRRRRELIDHRTGRDLRPGPHDHALRRRGRGSAPGERVGLRPRRHRLDHGPGPRCPSGPAV